MKTKDKPIDDKEGILNEIYGFYTNLYSTGEIDINQVNENLKYIDKTLPPQDSKALNGFISHKEVRKAISGMKNEKSPGEDGIPKEFYDKYYHLLEDHLSELYNNILLSKEQPQSQKKALVKLHRELKNWRLVSLLNTDYKILSKILTNRIYTVLPMIVPEEQKCGINGRKMNDVIRSLASYKDHAMNGFFVLVDQAKAFDRVNHEYLFMTMEAWASKGDFLT